MLTQELLIRLPKRCVSCGGAWPRDCKVMGMDICVHLGMCPLGYMCLLGYVSTWIYVHLGMCPLGYVSTWVWALGYVSTWVCVHLDMCPLGYVSTFNILFDPAS